jgi:glycosyltransferase involved in cell wall biosynthesis
MHICLYTATALPKVGGQELVVDALARQFAARGHDVVVLAPRPRRPLRADDGSLPYPVVRHPRFVSTRRLISWYRWWLLRLHRARGFDLLHCHGTYPPGYLAALCRAHLDVPVVITSHGGAVRSGSTGPLAPLLRRRHARALAAADALVAISRFTHEGYRQLCPQPPPIIAIPNGVDADAYAAPAPRPIDLDPAVRPGAYFLFLGRLRRQKGVDILLEAFARTRAGGDLRLAIAGEGAERRSLETMAAGMGLGGRVRFVGPAAGALKTYLLQNALALVVPSRGWEGSSLVALESYAAGRPVIASDLAGLRDLVRAEQTGLLVPAESPEALAQAMERMVSDRAWAGALGAEARAAAQDYRWDVIAARHLDLYADLRAGRAGRKGSPPAV